MADASRPANGSTVLTLSPTASITPGREVRDHHCHAEQCEAECPPRHLFCRKHWAMLPTPAQRVVWHYYVPGQERTKTPTAHYVLAMRVAVVIVAFKDRHWSQRHCFDQIADACFRATKARVPTRDMDSIVRSMVGTVLDEKKDEQLDMFGGSKKR